MVGSKTSILPAALQIKALVHLSSQPTFFVGSSFRVAQGPPEVGEESGRDVRPLLLFGVWTGGSTRAVTELEPSSDEGRGPIAAENHREGRQG